MALVITATQRRRFATVGRAAPELRSDSERRKVVEAELSRAKEELAEAARVRTEFVASVSHELRTPLANMLGYAEMLADGDAGALTPPQAKMLAVVDRNARRLLGLIEDLFELSQMNPGRARDVRGPLDVSDLVQHAIEAMAPSLASRQLKIIVETRGDVGTVDGDRDRLARVLHNLIDNAVNSTPDGGHVTVCASRIGDCVTFRVVDTGVGIDDEDQLHVFEPFFRTVAAQQSVPGAGLGLATVRSIVEAHDGRVDLVSTPGAGTTVTVRLPARVVAHATGLSM